MYTLLLLLSPIIMLLAAFITFKQDKNLKKSAWQLTKISIKYAIIGTVITLLYSYFALSVRGNISITEINSETLTSLLFLSPVGSAFGQLIALIRWKYLKII